MESGKRKVESGKRLVGERYVLSGLQIRSLRVSDTFSWSFRYVLSKAVQLCDRSLRMERLLVADERFIRPRCAYHPSETSIRSVRNYHLLRSKLAFAPFATGVCKVSTSWPSDDIGADILHLLFLQKLISQISPSG